MDVPEDKGEFSGLAPNSSPRFETRVSAYSSAVSCQLSVVSCQLSVVSCLLSVVSCLLSAVCCQLSAVSCQLSVVSCQLSVVSCQLSVVSCQLSVVSCQPASRSVPERLAGLQGMLNSFQRLPFSTQREKGLPLKVQQVLLRNGGRMIEVTSGEDVGKFFPNQQVVL